MISQDQVPKSTQKFCDLIPACNEEMPRVPAPAMCWTVEGCGAEAFDDGMSMGFHYEKLSISMGFTYETWWFLWDFTMKTGDWMGFDEIWFFRKQTWWFHRILPGMVISPGI